MKPMTIIKKNQGYTLFEVMIAVLVVSFGMIALAGLMVSSMRYSKESANRFVATQQLYEITDRMRANYKGVNAGYYDAISGLGNAVDCRAAACSASALAQFDAYEWNKKNSTVLPKGEGMVSKSANGYLVTLQWSETETNNPTPVTKSIKMKVTP